MHYFHGFHEGNPSDLVLHLIGQHSGNVIKMWDLETESGKEDFVAGPIHRLSRYVTGYDSHIGKVVMGQSLLVAEVKEGLIRALTKEPKPRQGLNDNSDISSRDLAMLKIVINVGKKKGIPLIPISIKSNTISD